MAREFTNYRQSADIRERLQTVPLLAVVGPSKAGKTTLMEYARAQDPSLHFVVSEVSRPSRPNETPGIHYYFEARQVMEARARAGSYATVAPSVTGELYATSPDEYDHYGQPIMAVLASAIPAFRTVFPVMRTVFVLPPSLDTWLGRDEARDQQDKRLAEARESLAFAATDTNTVCIINDDLVTAQAEFMQWLRGELSPQLQAAQTRAKRLAGELLQELSKL